MAGLHASLAFHCHCRHCHGSELYSFGWRDGWKDVLAVAYLILLFAGFVAPTEGQNESQPEGDMCTADTRKPSQRSQQANTQKFL